MYKQNKKNNKMTAKDYIIGIDWLHKEIVNYLMEITKGKTIKLNIDTDTRILILSISKGKFYYREIDTDGFLSDDTFGDDINLLGISELYSILVSLNIKERKERSKK